MSDIKKNTVAIEAVSRVPNERLEDLFEEAIRSKLTEEDCKLNIQEFDVDIRKELDQSGVFVDMTVYGMANNTTKDDFAKTDKKGNIEVVKGGGSFAVKLDDDSVVKFAFSNITNLNATDYLVTYRLV